jgi:hypothetical protein
MLGVILTTQTIFAFILAIYFVKFNFAFRSNCLLSVPRFLVPMLYVKQSCDDEPIHKRRISKILE